MKILFKRDALVHASSVVQSLVNPQSTLPILANVLLEAEGDKVRFTASDLESCVKCEVAADVETGGAITLPAKKLMEIVKELPDTDISMELDGTAVVIQCDRINERLYGLDPEDFPHWPEVKPIAQFEIGQRDLRQLIDKTLFAVPTRDPRKVLLGELFEIRDGHLRCVATDGKRLAFIETPMPKEAKVSNTSMIVPHKVLSELHRTLRDEGEVSVILGEKQVSFDIGQIVYVSNKIEGTYPNYELVIPKEFEREVTVSRAAFVAAIRRASVMSDERSRSVILAFKKNLLEISAVTFDLGSIKEEVEISYAFEPFEIAFNCQFLLEVLRVIDADQVLIQMNKPVSPTIFRAPGAENCFFVVMPIKITDTDVERE